MPIQDKLTDNTQTEAGIFKPTWRADNAPPVKYHPQGPPGVGTTLLSGKVLAITMDYFRIETKMPLTWAHTEGPICTTVTMSATYATFKTN